MHQLLFLTPLSVFSLGRFWAWRGGLLGLFLVSFSSPPLILQKPRFLTTVQHFLRVFQALEVSFEGQVESKLRLEASLECQVESKLGSESPKGSQSVTDEGVLESK